MPRTPRKKPALQQKLGFNTEPPLPAPFPVWDKRVDPDTDPVLQELNEEDDFEKYLETDVADPEDPDDDGPEELNFDDP